MRATAEYKQTISETPKLPANAAPSNPAVLARRAFAITADVRRRWIPRKIASSKARTAASAGIRLERENVRQRKKMIEKSPKPQQGARDSFSRRSEVRGTCRGHPAQTSASPDAQ